MSVRSASLVAAACALAVVAGCGGGSGGRLTKAQYEQQISREAAKLETAVRQVAANITGTNFKVLASRIQRAQAELAAAGATIAKLKAPSDVAKDNANLADALTKLSAQFSQLRNDASIGDLGALEAAYQGLGSSAAFREGQQATSDMRAKGYTLGALGPTG